MRVRSVRLRAGLEASAHFTLHAADLARLHDLRRPRQLVGDYRTHKSNAMKTPYRDRRSSIARNPNRGPTRIKMLGVWQGTQPGDEHSLRFPHGWRQVIRIERWRLHDRLAQHFLVCPRCERTPGAPSRRAVSRSNPPRKHLKLYMPLMTRQEFADSRLAEGWVRMLDERRIAARMSIDRDLAKLRARIIDRYAPVMRGGGRELVCRQCLGMRYGEVKWPRLKAREQRLREEYERTRAAEDAAKLAEIEAERDRDERLLRDAIGPELLMEQVRELEEARLHRERRERENARRRERRRLGREMGEAFVKCERTRRRHTKLRREIKRAKSLFEQLEVAAPRGVNDNA